MRKICLLLFLLMFATGCAHWENMKEYNAQDNRDTRAYDAEVNARRAYENDRRMRIQNNDDYDLTPIILWEKRF